MNDGPRICLSVRRVMVEDYPMIRVEIDDKVIHLRLDQADGVGDTLRTLALRPGAGIMVSSPL